MNNSRAPGIANDMISNENDASGGSSPIASRNGNVKTFAVMTDKIISREVRVKTTPLIPYIIRLVAFQFISI